MTKNILSLFLMVFFFINCNAQEEIKTISTKELKILLSKENVQLLDVRTPIETKFGYIESALFINYFNSDFVEQAVNKLDKEKPVYVYCRSGKRSAKASKLLKEKGFNVFDVLGGYNQWTKENQK
ncbi:rhodanese-like domain-containing protein [Polaribacter sargassicola]|uniref:rhodanese-like domain-containing protein n=1 Tax=Polaribacter sargassicola TaxID=2836891 RepID=UPI001F17F4EE|nr:rhodanese-like domain-containing protein [Polaribacter sp. DS7-9]